MDKLLEHTKQIKNFSIFTYKYILVYVHSKHNQDAANVLVQQRHSNPICNSFISTDSVISFSPINDCDKHNGGTHTSSPLLFFACSSAIAIWHSPQTEFNQFFIKPSIYPLKLFVFDLFTCHFTTNSQVPSLAAQRAVRWIFGLYRPGLIRRRLWRH